MEAARRQSQRRAAKGSGKQQSLASSPASDDLYQAQADQGNSRQKQQHAPDVIMIDASDSENAPSSSGQASPVSRRRYPAPAREAAAAAAAVAAAAARLEARQQALAARAAAAAAADAMTISDSEEGSDDGSGASGGDEQEGGHGSAQICSDDEPSTAGRHKQQPQQHQPHATHRQGRQRAAAGHGAAAAGEATQQRSSIDQSSEESSDDSSDESSSSSSNSSSESDDDDLVQQPTHSKQRKAAPAAAAAAATASGQAASTPSTRKSSRAKEHAPAGAAGKARQPSSSSMPAGVKSGAKAAPAAAATPRKGQCQGAAAAAATPSRPVRSCTQTPQYGTRPAAAGAAARTPGLSTPLGKLSLASKLQDAPSSAAAAAARPTRSTSKLIGPAASTRKGQAPATPAGKQQAGACSSRAAAAATTPAVTPKKRVGKGGGSSSKTVALQQVVIDDEVIMPGDDVYLMLDDYDADEDDEEEEEACEVCCSSKTSRANAMLECSTCLRGFHMRCLKPALTKIPEGDWLCPSCNAGEPPAPPARLVSHWQKLLYGTNQLALVHVFGLQRGKSPEGEDEDQLLVRYYILPQDTHLGRQPHHAARELFLGSQEYVEPACAVAGRGYVHRPADFAEAPEAEGNDVYLCEYQYDEAWKRFRKRRYEEEAAGPGELGGTNGSCPMTPAGLRLTPGKGKSPAAAAGGGGGKGGRRLFGGDSSSDDDDYSCNSDDGADDNYQPELHHFSSRGKAGALSKRKRHGQLPGAAAALDKFVGLGASDVGRERVELKDAFAKLHASLSLGAVPESLPCRDEERKRLGGYLKRALNEDGGVLYICGVPGTGKTALVMEMLRALRPKALEAGAQLVAINCLQLPTPQHVFSRLWEKLSGQHLGPARACEALMQSFGINGSGATRQRHYSTIIVLDEIDMLMTRDQAVLYQVFDWPNQPGSRLAVIGISNTHDLDQRVLPRIASRLDQAKLAFAPYSVAQLQAIVGQRLQDSGVAGAVEDMAVMLSCRKVASETGDVRRALELLRRAVEIGRAEHLRSTVVARNAAAAAAKQPPPADHDVVIEWQPGSAALVRRPHVTQAQQEMFGALHLQLLRSRSLWEKVLLVAVVVEARATGRSAVVIQSVAERASNSICSLVDLAPPALGVLQHCLVKLASVRLLLSDGCHIKAQVALNVDKDDVAIAIKEDERLQSLHQLL